jgi:hypothetical protein
MGARKLPECGNDEADITFSYLPICKAMAVGWKN